MIKSKSSIGRDSFTNLDMLSCKWNWVYECIMQIFLEQKELFDRLLDTDLEKMNKL